MVRSRLSLRLVVVALAGAASCVKTSTGPSAAGAVAGFVTAVQTASDTAVVATPQTAAPPSANGGPAATASAITSAVEGGSNLVQLHGAAPFTQVIVSVANGSGTPPVQADSIGLVQAANAGSTGFFRLTLPAETSDQSIVVSFAKAIQFGAFDLQFQLVSSSGTVGAPAFVHTTLLKAGVGDVQAVVSWDQPTDVDLHVVEPSGFEVFWGQPVSPTGGQLDLDSNSLCTIDGKNTENIRWSSAAPSGQYTVRVAYFSNCQIATSTNYVVTVNNGAATSIFIGSLGPGDIDTGALNAGRTITTFTHSASSVVSQLFSAPGPAAPVNQAKLAISRRK